MAKVADVDSEMKNAELEHQYTWRIVADQVARADRPRLRFAYSAPHSCLVLFPDDPFVQLWGGFMFALLMYVAIFTPYRVALISDDSQGWVAADTAVDVIFFTDLLLNCLQAYYDEEKNLVVSLHCIFANYAKSWLMLDLLACLPMQYLQGAGNYNTLVRLSRLPRIYRLIRMFRLIRMLKLIRHRASVMRYMTHVFRISIGMERLFWFGITLTFMLHVSACTWAFVGRFSMDSDNNNWIVAGGFQDKSNMELYLISMYWTITTVATVGYGDILARNNFERAMNSVIMLLGVLLYSYMVGALTNVIGSLDTRKAKLTRNLETLSDLAREYHLGKAFYSKLTNAIEFEHRNNNKEIELLVSSLPLHLRNQLLVLIHRKKIENNVFFEGRSQHFVAYVLTSLRTMLVDLDDYIYKKGDYASELYFIVKGEVDFVLTVLSEDLSFLCMKAGNYFGEIELVFSGNRLRIHTTKVKERAELLTLGEDKFEDLVSTFEMEGMEIMSLADDRRKKMEKSMSEALEAHAMRRRVSRKFSIPMDPKMRRAKGLQFTKQLEVEIEASSQGDINVSECKLSSSSSEESRSSDPATPRLFRQSTRRRSLINKPMYERLTTKFRHDDDSSMRKLTKQVRTLTDSLTDMRGLVQQLSKKFNLSGNFTKEEELSPLRGVRSLRRLSFEKQRTPRSSSESSSSGSPNPL